MDVSVKDATETAGLLRSQVTLWGVPGDPRHDNARGWECVAGEAFADQVGKPCPGERSTGRTVPHPTDLLCGQPANRTGRFSMEADSWAQPGSFLGAEYAWMNEDGRLLGFEGCDQLPFSPAIDVTPEEHSASTPTGLAVEVSVPQNGTLKAGGRAQADVRDTTVTLPQGRGAEPFGGERA